MLGVYGERWIWGHLCISSDVAGASVYGPEVKRRKTEDERKAEKERKLEIKALAASADPTAEWSISQRQPWFDKQVPSAKPTEEQIAWLKEEGFIKEDEEGEKVCPFALANPVLG